MTTRTTHEALRTAITASGAGTASMRFKAPCHHPYDLAFRVRNVASIIGVLPSHADYCPYIFVDPRALGRPVSVLLLPPIPTTIASILRLLQISCPGRLKLIVRGAPSFVEDTQTFVPRSAALITLSVDLHAGCEEGHHASPRSSDAIPPLPVACSDTNSPVLELAHNSDDIVSDAAGSRDERVEVVGDVSLIDAKLRTLAEGSVCRAAHPEGMGIGLPPSAHITLSDDDADSDDPALTHGHDESEEDDDEGGPPGDSPAHEGGSPDIVGHEWLILVKVIRLQARVEHCAMWVSSQDDVGLFLLRARILLVPTDGLFEVYLPDMQPDPLCITLIVAPAWWRQLDVHALLVAVQDQDRDPFVVVVWPDDDLVDLLPLTLQPRNEDVGVFADFPTDGPDPSTWPHPPNGGVVVMHATEGVFAPLPTAQSILANDAIAVGAATITQPAQRPGNTIGLLGAGFEQGTLQLNSGSVNSQIGDAIGEPSTEFSVWVQMAMFHELVIHGQHVGRCIAYKMKRCLSPLAATAIFVDGRKVGRPVCCRCLQHTFLEPAEVLQLISVQLPEGYRAMQVRVASDVATQHALLFMNCQSVVVWAESMTPHALLAGPDPASAEEPDTDSSDGPSDVSESPRDHQPGLRDSQDSGSRGHCGRRLDRSRSPTPAASGPTEVHLAAGRLGMDKSFPGGRVCVGRGVPTPCRGRKRLRTPAGPHGQQFVWKRVHPEHRRFAAYGAAIMLATVGAASAECSAVEDSSDVGEFFVGDCSVMWMPGFSEHVRAPYRLADTPDNVSILGFPRAVMGTVIDGVCAPMRRCALDGLARKFLTVYDGDAAVAAADAPCAALHIDRKTLRLGEYLPLCDTGVHCLLPSSPCCDAGC